MLERLLGLLPSSLRPSVLVLGLLACIASAAVGVALGYRLAKALGDAEVQRLHAEHDRQALEASQQSLLHLNQQVTRANQAEELLLQAQQKLGEARQQLQERIPDVTTVYRPAPAAAPVAIPRCVFTAGWLRDYNLALGVPTPASGTAAAGSDRAAWPAPGSDAELLESGVTPADILAHAQDYGRWAQAKLAQLNALLDLQKD